MPIKYNPCQRVRYVLAADRELPASEQVIFIFRPPRVRDRDRLSSMIMECLAPQLNEAGEIMVDESGSPKMSADPMKMLSSGIMTEILLCTLESAENWDVELSKNGRGCISIDGLDQISPTDRAELANEALKLLAITEQDSD